MDAEEELKVEDAANFDAVLVGGILGELTLSFSCVPEEIALSPKHHCGFR